MADAEHSKCFSERSAGSSPAFGTKQQRRGLRTSSFFVCRRRCPNFPVTYPNDESFGGLELLMRCCASIKFSGFKSRLRHVNTENPLRTNLRGFLFLSLSSGNQVQRRLRRRQRGEREGCWLNLGCQEGFRQPQQLLRPAWLGLGPERFRQPGASFHRCA
jgi:hypothetical protein